ncbi:MAG TPA: cation diffusion facilitator family transporter [Gammaproteobacteria bacterium]|nr:cation diffusion facilitator family transporter [Gammaproteobacteria bacterium]
MQADNDHRQSIMTRATLVSISVNLVLSIAQLIIGFVGHSQALIADSIHTLSDLTADFLVLAVTRAANKGADEDHPYGHTRYETLATTGLSILLMAVAVGIAISSVDRIFNPTGITPSMITLWAALLTTLGKEGLYHYTVHVARKVKSRMLEASAWHHRSDAISSVVVLVGIAGAIMGIPMFDSLAALIVAVLIARIGWHLGYRSVQELTDTGLEPERLQAIRNTIQNVDGVKELHLLRTRTMGPHALVDVHILVDSQLSVSEGHQISEAVEYALIGEFAEINDVTVHIDPEDDETTPNSCRHLPLRKEVLQRLQTCWVNIPQASHIQRTILHYIEGRVNVEVILPLSEFDSVDSANQLRHQLNTAAAQCEVIGKVDVYFS